MRHSFAASLLTFAYPNSSLINLTGRNGTSSGYRKPLKLPGRYNMSEDPRACARIVLPTDWARTDIGTLFVYDELYTSDSEDDEDGLSIEYAPIMTHRNICCGTSFHLWAMYNYLPVACDIGDVVNITGFGGPIWFTTAIIEATEQAWKICRQRRSNGTVSSTTIHTAVGPSWCVRNSSAADDSILGPSLVLHGTPIEQNLARILSKSPVRVRRKDPPGPRKRSSNATPTTDAHKTRQSSILATSAKTLTVLPADICTILRPVSDSYSSHICVLVSSMLTHGSGYPSQRIVWISHLSIQTAAATLLPLSGQINVSDMPEWAHHDGAIPKKPQRTASRNKGILEDGTPFVVYRFALYADGFKQVKSLSDTRSVTGCYLLPLGLSSQSSKSPSAARVISLVPNGQEPNDVLNIVVDNVLDGSLNGFQTTDAYNRKVHCFLDMVAFFGDSPAAAAVSDVKVHTANALCTSCTFTRKRGSTRSDYMFSSDIHSRRLSHSRMDVRSDILRRHNLSDEMRVRLGMKCATEEESNSLPMVRFSSEMNSLQSKVYTTAEGLPVIPPVFDSHTNVPPVPDHLLTGLINNTLNFYFLCLPTDEKRREFEIELLCTLSSNGLVTARSIVKWSKQDKYQGLESMTMSMLFSVLLVSAYISQDLPSILPVCNLLKLLQDVVVNVYTVKKKGQMDGRPVSHSDLFQSARNYLTGAERCVQQCPMLARCLDKPNFHRLVELCVNSIPSFGHGLVLSELVLEMVHRVFKTWIETNTNPNSHITAMEQALSLDWTFRIRTLLQMRERGESKQQLYASAVLRRLLLGQRVCDLDPLQEDVRFFFQQCEDKLDDFQEILFEVSCQKFKADTMEVLGVRSSERGNQLYLQQNPADCHPFFLLDIPWKLSASLTTALFLHQYSSSSGQPYPMTVEEYFHQRLIPITQFMQIVQSRPPFQNRTAMTPSYSLAVTRRTAPIMRCRQLHVSQP